MEGSIITADKLFLEFQKEKFVAIPLIDLGRVVGDAFLKKHFIKYAFILHRIISLQATCKSRGTRRGYVYLSSKEIKNALGRHYRFMGDLINAGVIERKNYVVGKHAYRYRLARKYWKTTEWILIKMPISRRAINSTLQLNHLSPTLEFLKEQLSRIEIDCKCVDFITYAYSYFNKSWVYIPQSCSKDSYTIKFKRFINNIPQPTYPPSLHYVSTFYKNIIEEREKKGKKYTTSHFIHDLTQVLQLARGNNWYLCRDKTGNRVHTPITSLSSHLRHFVRAKGIDENLVSVDLSNSQVFLVNLFLKEAKVDFDLPDVEEFARLTSKGEFYEFMKDKTGSPCREQLKKRFFSGYFFSKNKDGTSLFKDTMAKYFPTIHGFVQKEKEKDHSSFAIKLQKAESGFFIDRIVPRLMSELPLGAFVATIHDSILTNKSNAIVVEAVIKSEFEKDGLFPSVKVKEYHRW